MNLRQLYVPYNIVPEYFENTFTNELYNTIYTGILKSHPVETDSIDNIMKRLESPQKQQFISLFIDLKTKNVITNFTFLFIEFYKNNYTLIIIF